MVLKLLEEDTDPITSEDILSITSTLLTTEQETSPQTPEKEKKNFCSSRYSTVVKYVSVLFKVNCVPSLYVNVQTVPTPM